MGKWFGFKIKFFTSLREISGKKVDEIHFQRTITVNELLALLSEKYGTEFRDYIYDQKRKVQGFLSFILNDKNINKMQGLDTKLKEGDILAILPPVGGG